MNYTYEKLIRDFNEKYYNTVYTSFDLEIFEIEDHAYLKVIKDGNASYPIVYPEIEKKDSELETILSLIEKVSYEIPYHYDEDEREPLIWLCNKFNISPKTKRELNDQDLLIQWAKDVAYYNIVGDDIEKEVKRSIDKGITTEEKLIIASTITARRIDLSDGYQKSSSYEIKNILRRTMIRLIRNGSILVNCLDYDGEEFSTVVYIKDFCNHKQDGKFMIVQNEEGEYSCSLCGTKFIYVEL